MPRHSLSALVFACSTLTAGGASAHITLDAPAPRHTDQKVGPCGVGANDARGDVVTTFQGGETIVVRWTETIEHPGHFRISFDDEGHDGFAEPAAYDDFYANAAVLVDEIADKVGFGQTYEQEITLPMMSCDTCTLQLIQVMTDKPPYAVGTNDLYYQCADIILEGATGTTGEATTDATTESGTSAATTAGDGTTGTVTTGATPGPTTGGTTASSEETGDTGDTSATGTSAGGTAGAPAETGCGCRSDGAGGGAAALGALLLLLRGRRRRTG